MIAFRINIAWLYHNRTTESTTLLKSDITDNFGCNLHVHIEHGKRRYSMHRAMVSEENFVLLKLKYPELIVGVYP